MMDWYYKVFKNERDKCVYGANHKIMISDDCCVNGNVIEVTNDVIKFHLI